MLAHVCSSVYISYLKKNEKETAVFHLINTKECECLARWAHSTSVHPHCPIFLTSERESKLRISKIWVENGNLAYTPFMLTFMTRIVPDFRNIYTQTQLNVHREELDTRLRTYNNSHNRIEKLQINCVLAKWNEILRFYFRKNQPIV